MTRGIGITTINMLVAYILDVGGIDRIHPNEHIEIHILK